MFRCLAECNTIPSSAVPLKLQWRLKLSSTLAGLELMDLIVARSHIELGGDNQESSRLSEPAFASGVLFPDRMTRRAVAV